MRFNSTKANAKIGQYLPTIFVKKKEGYVNVRV